MFALATTRNKSFSGDQPIQETHVVCNIVAGVVALVIACVFMVGWVRSNSLRDQAIFPYGDFESIGLISFDRSVLWGKEHDDRFKSKLAFPVFVSSPLGSGFVSFFDNESGVEWSWQWFGFGVGELRHTTTLDRLTFWIVPYWSLVVPFTLLSAWLLLSKPRAKKVSAPTERI